MTDARISLRVVVGLGSDVGGGASIMGSPSGARPSRSAISPKQPHPGQCQRAPVSRGERSERRPPGNQERAFRAQASGSPNP